MGSLSKAFSYSIGKKLIMGLTGVFLILFLVEHLIGNCLLFVGPSSYNAYAEFMGHNIFIRVAEVVLFLGFIVHIADGIMLVMANKKARPVAYAVSGGKHNSSWFSRNMKTTGIILLVFLILHLISFFMVARFGVDVGMGIDMQAFPYDKVMIGPDEHSIWHKTAAQLSVEWYAGIYVIAMVIVGFHLNHGFQSAFQTLGVRHAKYTPLIKGAGKAFSIVVPAVFAAIPIYFVILKHMGELSAYFLPPFGY